MKITPGTRFDHHREGKTDVLSAKETAGLRAFMMKRSTSCHAVRDRRRSVVTKAESADYVLRAAPLRTLTGAQPAITVPNLSVETGSPPRPQP